MATLNVENLRSNLAYVHYLLEKNQLLLLQEHWLFNFEIPDIGSLLQGYNFQVKCIDDDAPIAPLMRPRGNAGVITVWSRDIDHLVTPLTDGSDRLVVSKIGNEEKAVIVINAYMPTDGSKVSYDEMLDEVFEIIEKYSSRNNEVIWAGDINASFDRKNPSSNDRKFRLFCNEMNLKTITPKGQPTYHHFVDGITSCIDHVLHYSGSPNPLSPGSIDARNPLNMSSHDPVLTSIKLESGSLRPQSSHATNIARKKPNWKKMDIDKYSELTQVKLESFLKHGGMQLPLEVIVDRIYDILLSSSDECSPVVKRKMGKKVGSYPWSSDMKPVIAKTKQLFYEWKLIGRPQDHSLVKEIKTQKKFLRSMQRQLAACHRKDTLQEISQASTDNRHLFYKLVANQRNGKKVGSMSVDFKDGSANQLEGWASYFEDLASDKSMDCFDDDFYRTAKLNYHLTYLQNAGIKKERAPISKEKIETHIKNLKNRKAADVYGLTGEHLKYASALLPGVMANLIDMIYKHSKIPDQFKIGAIVPVLKKNKPSRMPDSYRRITIASNLGKIMEKCMMEETICCTSEHQNPLQYGFTKGVSPAFCALLITEAIAEAADTKSQVFLSFMDSSKAFDMVNHKIMLNSLEEHGLDPKLWNLYADMYAKVTSKVRIENGLSRSIMEGRGIRQGGETSTEAFKAKENKFLNRIRNHPSSYCIGSIKVGIPTVADDNCMIATSHTGAQTQLLIAQDNASKIRYIFNENKSRVVCIGQDSHLEMPLKFNSGEIAYSEREVHLGLVRTSNGKATEAVRERIKTGRRTAYALMGAGLHGFNGISPHISKNLISTYIEPAIHYGLEALSMNQADFDELDKNHRLLLRQIQGLPQSTAAPGILLLIGAIPLSAQVHRKILCMYISILQQPSSLEYEVLYRQLCVKNMSSKSWVTGLRKLLYMYNLPSPIQLLEHPPEPSKWKRRVKSEISKYWQSVLQERAREMTSLKHLNVDKCQIGTSHPVWLCGDDPLQVTKAHTKALLLLGRYPLSSNRCAGRYQQSMCPLCEKSPENLQHFLLECTALSDQRKKFSTQVSNLMHIYNVRNTEDKVKFVIDPSNFITNQKENLLAEDITRRMCYSLHSQRASILGFSTKRSPRTAKPRNEPDTKHEVASLQPTSGPEGAPMKRRNLTHK